MSDFNILNLIQCSATDDKHILQTGIALSCGHHVCKKCIPQNNSYQIKCLKCNKTNQHNLSLSEESEITKYLIESNLAFLFKTTKENIEIEEQKYHSNP